MAVEVIQTIQTPRLFLKYMNNQIIAINQNPLAVCIAFHVQKILPALLARLERRIRETSGMPPRSRSCENAGVSYGIVA